MIVVPRDSVPGEPISEEERISSGRQCKEIFVSLVLLVKADNICQTTSAGEELSFLQVLKGSVLPPPPPQCLFSKEKKRSKVTIMFSQESYPSSLVNKD